MNGLASARHFIESLNRLDTPYMVVGSLSSNLYGVPRSTADADFVVESDQSINALADAVAPHFRMEPQTGFETVGMTTKHVFYARNSPFQIEVFTLSDDPHDQERFARRRRQGTGPLSIVAPTAEDVIIQKLRWGRGKDRQDVRDILSVQAGHLDLDYLHAWCNTHGTRDLLEEIRAQPPE